MEALIEAINICPVVDKPMLVGWQLGKYSSAPFIWLVSA